MSGVCGRGKGGTVTVFCLQVTGLADLTGGSALSIGLMKQEDGSCVVSFGNGNWSVFNKQAEGYTRILW